MYGSDLNNTILIFDRIHYPSHEEDAVGGLVSDEEQEGMIRHEGRRGFHFTLLSIVN